MTTTLRGVGDRLGHAAVLLLLTGAAASAEPDACRARRFDMTAVAVNSGLDVTESITFEFRSGTFSRYQAGRLTTAEPAWPTRQSAAKALAPAWAMGGAAIFAAVMLLVAGIQHGYAAPESVPDQTTVSEPPAPLPAALASNLAANGRANGYQPIATLLDLADRGALRIEETDRLLGFRSYHLVQVAGWHDLSAHEIAALRIAFAGSADSVPLAQARGRVVRAWRPFAAAVKADLLERGLLDPDRKAARDRVATVAIAAALLSALGASAAELFIPTYGAWPFLLPLGLFAAGIAAGIIAASMTPLSDEGLVAATRWRGFRRYMKSMATGCDERGTAVPSRWIVYAIALGLGHSWGRYLRRHPAAAPGWFVTSGDDAAAFAAFVGSHGAGGAGAGRAGAGGGGAAGGGASGAG